MALSPPRRGVSSAVRGAAGLSPRLDRSAFQSTGKNWSGCREALAAAAFYSAVFGLFEEVAGPQALVFSFFMTAGWCEIGPVWAGSDPRAVTFRTAGGFLAAMTCWALRPGKKRLVHPAFSNVRFAAQRWIGGACAWLTDRHASAVRPRQGPTRSPPRAALDYMAGNGGDHDAGTGPVVGARHQTALPPAFHFHCRWLFDAILYGSTE